MKKKTNKEVVEAFINGRKAIGSKIISTGYSLIHYATLIAVSNNITRNEYLTDYIVINNQKYSTSTSTVQNLLIKKGIERFGEKGVIIANHEHTRNYLLGSPTCHPYNLIRIKTEDFNNLRNSEPTGARKAFKEGRI